MKKYIKFLYLAIAVMLTSCKTIIANPGKPLEDIDLKINSRYEIQDYKAKIHHIRIISIDKNNVYGISEKREMVTLDKKQIRQVKRIKVCSSIVVGVLAIATVIFVPI